jgi:hypothetical protein
VAARIEIPRELASRHKRIRLNALPRWQSQSIIWAGISLTASGLWWLLVLLRRAPDALPGQLDPWLARWHGLSSMAGLFAFGVIASRHIGRGWSLGKRLKSGLGTVALFALLILTGFALAYLVPEEWHQRLGWLHSALGVLAFTLGAVHRR